VEGLRDKRPLFMRWTFSQTVIAFESHHSTDSERRVVWGGRVAVLR
jgi:hypothetical protein